MQETSYSVTSRYSAATSFLEDCLYQIQIEWWVAELHSCIRQLELILKTLSYEFSILVYDCSKLNKVSVWWYEYIFWNCYRSLCIYFYKTSSPSMIRYFLWMRSKTGFFQDCFSNRLLLLGHQHKSKGCKTFFFKG